MCKKTQFKYCPSKIDECMKEEIEALNKAGIETLSCCCGHKKYPKTIVVKHSGTKMPFEYFSKQYILRKRKFYKRDKEGYYFIPEVVEKLNRKEGELKC